MNKTKGSNLILGLLFVVYAVVSFCIPVERGTLFWVAFSSGVVAFVMLWYTFQKAFGTASTATSKVLGWPIFKVGYTYLALQMVLGLVLMVASAYIPNWVGYIAEVALFVWAAVCLTATQVAREAVTKIGEKKAVKTQFILEFRSQVNGFVVTQSSKPWAKELTDLAEAVKFSDPVSSGNLESIEQELFDKFLALKEVVKTENPAQITSACQAFLNCLAERNAMCKSGK